MQVEAIPIKDFVHGDIYAKRNRPFMVDDSIAGDLERAGLVRIKTLAPYRGDTGPAGKAPAAGLVPPSPASPAAQASRSGTLHLPEHGSERTRKPDTSSR